MNAAPLRTLIADDEPVARARLRILCEAMADLVHVVSEAATGTQALDQIRTASPDLVLLDIAMPDLNGLEVGTALGKTAAPPAIVFCTAYPRYALAAFEVAAVDYLLKPVDRERLARAVTRAARPQMADTPFVSQLPQWLDNLWVPHRDAMIRIDIEDVHRIEAEGDYVRIVTAQAGYLLHETMTRLEVRLDPERFTRVRRSMIVRTDLLDEAVHLGAVPGT